MIVCSITEHGQTHKRPSVLFVLRDKGYLISQSKMERDDTRLSHLTRMEVDHIEEQIMEWLQPIQHSGFSGYNQYIGEESGLIYYDNKRTGEVTQAMLEPFPVGSSIYTPAQREAQEAYSRRMRQIRNAKEHQKELGSYIFAIAEQDAFAELEPETLARAVYLATYVDYKSSELLRRHPNKTRERMRYHDLPAVMGMSREWTYKNFWKKVDGKFFFRDGNGFINTMGTAFIRGRLKADCTIEYQKVYRDSIRELYGKVQVKQHRRLGYAFKMMPFINFEYNVLCLNPDEPDYTAIVPLTMEDFCKLNGYDIRHAGKLEKEYAALTFTVNCFGEKRQEVFCKFVRGSGSVKDDYIYINPRLIYKGSDFYKVAGIGISFAASSKAVMESGESGVA